MCSRVLITAARGGSCSERIITADGFALEVEVAQNHEMQVPVVVEERITMAHVFAVFERLPSQIQTKVHVRLGGLVPLARVRVVLQRTRDPCVPVRQREESPNIRCETDGPDADVPLIDLVFHPVDDIQCKVYATLEILLPATELAIDHRCGVVEHKHDVLVACLHGRGRRGCRRSCGRCGR